jgi:hypothetical protein
LPVVLVLVPHGKRVLQLGDDVGEALFLRAAGAGVELAEGAFGEAFRVGSAFIATGYKIPKPLENEPT